MWVDADTTGADPLIQLLIRKQIYVFPLAEQPVDLSNLLVPQHHTTHSNLSRAAFFNNNKLRSDCAHNEF